MQIFMLFSIFLHHYLTFFWDELKKSQPYNYSNLKLEIFLQMADRDWLGIYCKEEVGLDFSRSRHLFSVDK